MPKDQDAGDDDLAEIGDNSDLDISFSDISPVVSDLAQSAKAVAEATGSLRSKIKAILDDKGWNKKALGMIRTIDAMSDTARADFLRSFQPMFEAMYAGKWLSAKQDMIDALDEELD